MAMQQTYTVAMVNQTVIANSELVIIRAATAYASRASMLKVIRLECSQMGTATSQQLGVQWGLQATAFGTYTSTTPVPVAIGTVASAIAGSTTNAASSCGTDSSAISAGTFTALGSSGFNNLNGFLWVPTENEEITVGPDLTFGFRLIGTPTTLTGWSATLTFRELT